MTNAASFRIQTSVISGEFRKKYLLTAVLRDIVSECGLDSAAFLLKHVLVLDKVRALLNISLCLYFGSC